MSFSLVCWASSIQTNEKSRNTASLQEEIHISDGSRCSIESSAMFVLEWEANASMHKGDPLTPTHAATVCATLHAEDFFQIQQGMSSLPSTCQLHAGHA
jgi:hypothetical protein